MMGGATGKDSGRSAGSGQAMGETRDPEVSFAPLRRAIFL